MSNRAAAFSYGLIVSSALAILLLLLDEPSPRNLIISITAGVLVWIGFWIHLERT